MGEPGVPTETERQERRALARKIVAAVRDDEDDAIDAYYTRRALFGLAQEVLMLLGEEPPLELT